MRSREGLQKIYPQNLKKERKVERGTQVEENKRDKTQNIYKYNGLNCTQMINQITLVTQLLVYTQALHAVQDSLSPRIAFRPKLFTPRHIGTLIPS